jgi:hypothetical protein
MSELTSYDIEVAVANYFNPRIHLIVPNISHGMYLHECDLLVMNGRNYGVEVEIKISKADVKKDLKKPHQHNSNRIRRLFFAIPEKLYIDDVVAMIPERAGIFVIEPAKKVLYSAGGKDNVSYTVPPKCVQKRSAKINKYARPFSDSERIEMGRLGMLRYWNIRNRKK